MKLKINALGWFLIALQTIGAALPTYLALYLTETKNPGSVSLLNWILFPTIGGVVAFGVSLGREYKNKRYDHLEKINKAVERADVEVIINGALESIANQKKDRCANIMIIDYTDKIPCLKIQYRYSPTSDSELGITWQKHEGCCGRAWADNQQVIVDLTQVNETDMHDKWQMNQPQILCTKNLGAVISTPLRSIMNRQDVVGVLNCDSTLPLEKSGLRKSEFVNHFEQHAMLISRLLPILNEVKNDD